jgi:ubiquinone/menaquinone biosynthesis C-methylase UbiE
MTKKINNIIVTPTRNSDLIPDDCKKMLDVGCGQGNFSFQIKKERPDSEMGYRN